MRPAGRSTGGPAPGRAARCGARRRRRGTRGTPSPHAAPRSRPSARRECGDAVPGLPARRNSKPYSPRHNDQGDLEDAWDPPAPLARLRRGGGRRPARSARGHRQEGERPRRPDGQHGDRERTGHRHRATRGAQEGPGSRQLPPAAPPAGERDRRGVAAIAAGRVLNIAPSPAREEDHTPDAAEEAGHLKAVDPRERVDLRAPWYRIGDQGKTGSCVGWARADSVMWPQLVAADRLAHDEWLSPRFMWMAAKEMRAKL